MPMLPVAALLPRSRYVQRPRVLSGLLVAQNMEPVRVSVLYRGEWVLLDDNGGMKEVA